jgi:hypothetical protein
MRYSASASEAISALTRVHSPSKTGVNAVNDALWRNADTPDVVAALIAPISERVTP